MRIAATYPLLIGALSFGALSALRAQEDESSADPSLAMKQAVSFGDELSGKLEVGEMEIAEVDGHLTVQVPVTNVSNEAVGFTLHTTFLRSDGSSATVRKPSYLEAMTRGIMGLISLGTTEVTMQSDARKAEAFSDHVVEPHATAYVTHQLAYSGSDIVSVESSLRSATAVARLAKDKQELQAMQDDYWKVRNKYFEDRKEEFARWDELRDKLEEEREQLSPTSAKYKKSMARYWEERKAHLDQLAELEGKFAQFKAKQEERRDSMVPQSEG